MTATGNVTSRLLAIAWLALFGACGSDLPAEQDGDTAVGDQAGDTDTSSDAAADADADADGDVPTEVTTDAVPDGLGDGGACGSTQCSNCVDDDGDTVIDGFDPHCSSWRDDDEGSFETGIPGDNQDGRWQDCFFDGNSGGGGNDCRFHTCCLLTTCPEELASGFNRETDCDLTTECIEYCLPSTTPGCDCFGCCEIFVDDVSYTVYTNPAVAPNCTLDVIDDPDLCPPCTPTTDCSNPCEPAGCELCPGQTIDDLPPECTGQHDCDEGVTPCETTADCPSGYYCSLGCCIEQVIIT